MRHQSGSSYTEPYGSVSNTRVGGHARKSSAYDAERVVKAWEKNRELPEFTAKWRRTRGGALRTNDCTSNVRRRLLRSEPGSDGIHRDITLGQIQVGAGRGLLA